MLKRFYMRKDTEFDYREGDELYHVFERGRLNKFNEPYCVDSYLTYEQATELLNRLNNETSKVAV